MLALDPRSLIAMAGVMATAMAIVAALPAAAACGRLFAGAAQGRGRWRAAGSKDCPKAPT